MANKNAHDELMLLYQVTIGDLEFFKKQQWLVAYYCVLLYGALVALARVTDLEKLVFCIAVGGAASLSSILLLILEYSIGVRRDRLEAIRDEFSNEFKKAWKAGKKIADCHVVLIFILLTLISGATLTIFSFIHLIKTNAT